MLRKCGANDPLFPECKLCSEKFFLFMYSSWSTQGENYLDMMYGKNLVFYCNTFLLIWCWSKDLWFTVILVNFRWYFSLIWGIMCIFMRIFISTWFTCQFMSVFFFFARKTYFFKHNIICIIWFASQFMKKWKNCLNDFK